MSLWTMYMFTILEDVGLFLESFRDFVMINYADC